MYVGFDPYALSMKFIQTLKQNIEHTVREVCKTTRGLCRSSRQGREIMQLMNLFMTLQNSICQMNMRDRQKNIKIPVVNKKPDYYAEEEKSVPHGVIIRCQENRISRISQ